MRTLLTGLMIFGLLSAVRAGELKEREALAEKFIQLLEMEKNFDNSMKQAMQMSMSMIDQQDLPDDAKAQAKQAAQASMEVTFAKFKWSEMKSMFVEIYAEVLNAEELQGLIDFYSSPIGQQFIAKQPQLTTASMQKMQALMQKIMPEIQQEVERVIEEQQAARENAAGAEPTAE